MTLYRDAAIAMGSVLLLGVFANYAWLIDLSKEINQKPYVSEILQSTLKYVYLPFLLLCFIFGEVTKNISQVDKIWSVITPCFCWYITCLEASYHGMNFNHRLVLMSVVVTIWGARLTYQFFKKGGYSWKLWSGEEDYRWQVVRKEMPIIFENRLFFSLFNFGFICLYQLLLLFLITGGVMLSTILSNTSRNDLSVKDGVISVIVLFCIIIETISDHQHQLFQVEKYRRIKENISLNCPHYRYEVGFLTKGLFAYSRHPNFTAEQAIWFFFYLNSVNFSMTKRWYEIGGIANISIIGVLLLIILFMKSTDLTEKISSRKYPLYRLYQNKVNRILDVKLIICNVFLSRNPDDSWLNLKNN